jgi:hypothetical protein
MKGVISISQVKSVFTSKPVIILNYGFRLVDQNLLQAAKKKKNKKKEKKNKKKEKKIKEKKRK